MSKTALSALIIALSSKIVSVRLIHFSTLVSLATLNIWPYRIELLTELETLHITRNADLNLEHMTLLSFLEISRGSL